MTFCQKCVYNITLLYFFHLNMLIISIINLSLSFFLDYPCSSMLGMVSGQILDSQISVWPEVERGWLPEQARLLTGRSGWVAPSVPHDITNSSWLTVDLGNTHWVTALILQGGKHKNKIMFVKRFKLVYSTDGSDWRYIQEDNSNKAKVKRERKRKKWGENMPSY